MVLAVFAVITAPMNETLAAGRVLQRVARVVNAVRPGVVFAKPSGYSSQVSDNVVLSHGGYQTADSNIQPYNQSFAGGGSPSDVGQGTAAYAHCLQEAIIQARNRIQGHFLGVAPGAGMQGVGDSFSPYQPNHCTGIGLIARAGVKGDDGRWYWSAAYQASVGKLRR
jgi:hypothetical protein